MAISTFWSPISVSLYWAMGQELKSHSVMCRLVWKTLKIELDWTVSSFEVSQPVNFYLSLLCKLQLLRSVVSVSPVLCAEQEEYLSRKYVLIILGSPGVTQSPQSYLGSVSIFAARPLPFPPPLSSCTPRSLAIMNSLYLPNFISQKEIFSSLTVNTRPRVSIVPWTVDGDLQNEIICQFINNGAPQLYFDSREDCSNDNKWLCRRPRVSLWLFRGGAQSLVVTINPECDGGNPE